MTSRFNDKKVVVTGGNHGIGKAIALAFAEEGADIVITYNSNPESAQVVVAEIQALGRKAKALHINIINDTDRSKLVSESYDFLGDVDTIVNNAGMATRKPFLELSEAEITTVMTVNCLAPFFIMQGFAQRMFDQQNALKSKSLPLKDYSIINISSISREVVTFGLSHYETSKAALSQLTKSAAVDLARYKIRVNDVAPGTVPTGINQSQWGGNTEVWQHRVSCIPLNRPGQPQEIAHAVLFLAENQWATGSTIVVDGGRTCNWYGNEMNKSAT
jgi:glucose 1-dehydrogenase